MKKTKILKDFVDSIDKKRNLLLIFSRNKSKNKSSSKLHGKIRSRCSNL